MQPKGEFRTPSSIYAMKQADPMSSNRCLETVFPLSQALGIHVQNDFTKYDVWRLRDAILNDPGHTILVCWEHRMIPWIVHSFQFPVRYWGINPMLEEEDVYDVTWVLKNEKLCIYRQFKVVNRSIYYHFPRFDLVCTIEKEPSKVPKRTLRSCFRGFHRCC